MTSVLCCSGGSVHEILAGIRAIRSGKRAAWSAHDPVRMAIVYSGAADLKTSLERAESLAADSAPASRSDNADGLFLEYEQAATPNIAFLYPGQGSQSSRMLASLREVLPGFDGHLRRLDALWRQLSNESLVEIIYDAAGTEADARLTDTRRTQPALGLICTALRLALEDLGVRARFHAGHSYGELPALCAAGFLDPRTMLRLSRKRGQLLGAAGDVAPGAMVAVTGRVGRDVDHALELASINSPDQCVLAGRVAAVEAFEKAAAGAGFTVRRLRTSCAFHSSLMAPVAETWQNVLRSELDGQPAVPCGVAISNVSAAPYRSMDDVVQLLGQQIVRPVRWMESCAQLAAMGANIFVEAGPGRVLTDLLSKNLPAGVADLALVADPGQEDAGRHVANLVAQMAVRGVPVNWERFAPAPVAEAIVVAPAPAPVAVSANTNREIFESSRAVLEKYFAQQTGLVELALQRCASTECEPVVQAALASNQRIMSEFLAMQESALRVLLGQEGRAEPAAVLKSMAAPATAPTLSPAPATAAAAVSETPVEKIERLLRNGISKTTGFPPEAVAREASFNDLGLDSLSIAEIWSGVLQEMPELAGFADRVFDVRCIGDVAKLMDVKPEAVAAPVAAAAEARSDGGLICELARIVAARCGVEEISGAADFEEDLRLDVFTREELFREPLFEHPVYGQAGRELLNARNLNELAALLERFQVDEAEPVVRFVLGEEPVRSRATADTESMRQIERALLIGGSEGLRREVSDVCRLNGVDLVAVRHSPEAEEFRREADSLTRGAAYTVLFLAGASEDAAGPATALFAAAKALFAGAQPAPWATELIVVCTDADSAAAEGLRGVAKSLRREMANLPVRTISLTSPVKAVLAEALLSDAAEDDVIERDGVFTRQALHESRPFGSGAPTGIESSSRVLVLGGGDGITAEIGIGLAAAHGCEIVAVGRTPWADTFPYPEIPRDDAALKRRIFEDAGGASAEALQRRFRRLSRQRALWWTKQRVQAAGGRFTYHSVDVTDADAFRETLQTIGAVDAIVHGAGITKDNLVARKSVDEFRSVVLTKTVPALVMREMLAETPLRFVAFLSSLTSYTGTAGQTDYAAANGMLNAIAHQWNSSVDYPVKSLLWSVWTEAGLAGSNLKSHMARLGLGGIRTADGVKLLLGELERGAKSEDRVLFTPVSMLQYCLNARMTGSFAAAPKPPVELVRAAHAR